MRIRRKTFIYMWQSKRSRRGKRTRLLSFTLAGLCVALVVVSAGLLNEKNMQDEQARQATQALLAAAQATPAQDTAAQSLNATPRPAVLQDVGGYSIIAKLSIDKLALELPVIGETTDEALKVAPCLYSGPVTPTGDGNMVITGHNNKDDSQFGRLDELQEGDTVTLMDKWGDAFAYEIYGIETITPDNVAALEEYEGERALSLLTCTSHGNKRLLLRCRMIQNETGAS